MRLWLQYSGDMPMPRNGLHAYFVTATVGPAKLVAIDTTAALAMEEVVSFVGSEDIKGMNSSSFVPNEEQLFCKVGTETLYPGTLIGLVVAKTSRAAQAGAAAVKCTYSEPC